MSNTIQTSCPAFSDGCPYANPHDANDATARKDSTAKCPAFSSGCPFKEATTQQELAEMLKQVPDSHKAGGKIIGSISALHAIMASIHAQSTKTKEQVGADCPVFQSSCPFKNLTSSGTPLVAELEYRTWSVFQLNADTQDDNNDNDNDNDNDDNNDINILLSKNLKQGTKKSHRAAENVHFVKNFIKGKINKEVYKQMVLSLWHVYTALEDELRKNATNPIYQTLHFPRELERQTALEQDLQYYFGDQVEKMKQLDPSECTKSYVARIRKIGQESPELLVAHAYTRYLGDLSGGRVLMRVAKKAMQLPKTGEGTAFYVFDRIKNGNYFKKDYRKLLDNIKVTEAMADQIVSEANVAFVMNMRIFEELDVLAGDAASVRSLEQVMATLEMPVKKENKCPFAVMGMGGPNPHALGGSMPLPGQANTSTSTKADTEMIHKGECPWPFILTHDPIKGMQNPLTYVALVALFAVYFGSSTLATWWTWA